MKDLLQLIDRLEHGILPEVSGDIHTLAQTVADQKQDEREVDTKEMGESSGFLHMWWD